MSESLSAEKSQKDYGSNRSKSRGKSQNSNYSALLLTDKPSLEYRMCPHHPGTPLDYYSVNKRSFSCQQCAIEIAGTPSEADVNAMPVKDIVTMYQTQIDLQSILDLDQELSQMLVTMNQTREHIRSDRVSVIESIHNVFDDLQDELERRRRRVLNDTKREYKNQFNEIDDLERAMQSVQSRCKSIFPGYNPNQAFDYVKNLEKILDFQSDMISVNQDRLKIVRGEAKLDSQGLGRQRLQIAQQKTFNMVNSFRIDFSGQSVRVLTEIDNVGKLIHNKASLQNHSLCKSKSSLNFSKTLDHHQYIKDIKHSICQIEGSTILPQDYTRDHQITKNLPAFTQVPKLLLRLTESEHKYSNKQFHDLCDDKGPLLVLIKTKKAIFGGYSSQSWKSIGGYRKCRKSFLFRLSEPLRFTSKVIKEENKGYNRALFFNEKYGIVFGQGDLIIDFDDISKSSSKLGQSYKFPNSGKNEELALTGSNQVEFGKEIIQLELYALEN